MIGADLSLGAGDIIKCMHLMEEHTLSIAKQHGYKAIFGTNVSPLTQVNFST